MKNFVIMTNGNEIIGTGETIAQAIENALSGCTADDFIDWGCYAEETSEGIESFSMFELYDMTVAG